MRSIDPLHRTRKLHVSLSRRGVTPVWRIDVCRVDVAPRRRRLVSSTDGAMAMETHTLAAESRAFWRIDATHVLPYEDESPSQAARLAFYALAEPGVGAIAVHRANAPSATFLRDCAQWLDVPRPQHPLYSEKPEAA